MIKSNKIIFIDIDGVMNCKNWYIHQVKRLKSQPIVDIMPSAIKQLNRIVDAVPEVKFVISSTWRQHVQDIGAWNVFFHLLKCKAKIIGITPKLSSYRGTEILCWLIEYKCHHQLDSFVIIDDDDDMELLMPRLCLCNNDFGLTKEVADKAIKMLNEPVNLNITLEKVNG
jgi:hypothetical protein